MKEFAPKELASLVANSFLQELTLLKLRSEAKYYKVASSESISIPLSRALDTCKREYLVILRDNFRKFCIKTYVVIHHLNRLDETAQMRGHTIWF